MTDVVDPMRALRPLREEEITQLTRLHETADAAPLAYDVYRIGNELVIEFDAPGVAPEDIQVAVEGRTIAVSVHRGRNRGPGIDVIESCRQHGTFQKRLVLGSRWDLDGLTAHARDGVLSVRAPLAAEAAARRVQVTADNGTSDHLADVIGAPAEDRVHTAA